MAYPVNNNDYYYYFSIFSDVSGLLYRYLIEYKNDTRAVVVAASPHTQSREKKKIAASSLPVVLLLSCPSVMPPTRARNAGGHDQC